MRGLERMKDYCAALEPLYEAIRLNPQSSDAPYNLAVAQAQLGEKLQALDPLKKAIELQPDLAAEAERDPEFQRLQADPDFRAITRQGSSRDHGDDEHE
jgi:tetratricopeptide (TPR) repeat protein